MQGLETPLRKSRVVTIPVFDPNPCSDHWGQDLSFA